MMAFWKHGYETTSIADLTAAMGVTAPSLYAAFGDKKQLFLEAMKLYTGDPAAIEASIRDAPTAWDAARSLLTASAEGFTGKTTPPGCLLASATASGSAACADVRAEVAQVRRRIEDALQRRIKRDVVSGVLLGSTSPDALSGLVMAVIQGMSVLARDGAGRTKLEAISLQVLNAWPVNGDS